MLAILTPLYTFHKFLEKQRDERIDHFPMMGSPLKMIAVLAFYLYFVKKLGPKLMEKRKPLEINKILIWYNIIQVILNFAWFIYGTYLLFHYDYDVGCLRRDIGHGRKAMIECYMGYTYYLLKYLDLLDTVFFVLRKKYNQISFLHVYHHICILICTHIYITYELHGHSSPIPYLNTFVHGVMYSYYLLTAINPKYKYNVQWKKQITHIQLIQFILLARHFILPLINDYCDYPAIATIMPISQNVIMIILFSNFYIKTYLQKPKKQSVD